MILLKSLTRKYPSYLITRYPVGVDPSLALELPGNHFASRDRQKGVPVNRIVVAWSLPDQPPRIFSFSFLPCLPECEFRTIRDDQPSCFRCGRVGHLTRYCSVGVNVLVVLVHTTPAPANIALLRLLLFLPLLWSLQTEPLCLPSSTNTHWKSPKRCSMTQAPPPPPPVPSPPFLSYRQPLLTAVCICFLGVGTNP